MVGDVMYDATLYYSQAAERHSQILNRLQLQPRHYILVTVHRAENTDSVPRMRAILAGLSEVAGSFPVVLPLHPRTRKVLMERGEFQKIASTVRFTEPCGYLDMMMLEKNAVLIATDSGGVQKEAFFHRVPCVTLRDETEWVELVEMGWNRLAGPTSAQAISEAVREAIGSVPAFTSAPYGDGHSAEKIAAILDEHTEKATATA